MIIRWKTWVHGDTENVNVKLLRRLARIARDMTKRYHETGGKKHLRYTVYVRSGFRTRAEQQALYDRWRREPKVYARAAKPGTSNHEKMPVALAADSYLRFPNGHEGAIGRSRLAKYGLKAPVPGEPWHIELA